VRFVCRPPRPIPSPDAGDSGRLLCKHAQGTGTGIQLLGARPQTSQGGADIGWKEFLEAGERRLAGETAEGLHEEKSLPTKLHSQAAGRQQDQMGMNDTHQNLGL
jgi:hypothetical protein